MDNGLLEGLAEYFVQQHIVQEKGLDIFIESYPPLGFEPVVVLFEYAGSGVVDSYASNRSVQINVRGISTVEVKQKAWELFNCINKSNGILVTGDRYYIMSVRQTPFRTGRDEIKRVIYTFNLGIVSQND